MALHLALFGLARWTPEVRVVMPEPPAIQVELTPRPSRPPPPPRRATVTVRRAPEVGRAPRPEVDETPPVAAVPIQVITPVSRPRLDLDRLTGSAREVVREEALRGEVPAAGEAHSADRPILPALDRALRRESPGVRRLAGGLIRVVSESGTVYCLQEPPSYARGGPAELPAVPTTCP